MVLFFTFLDYSAWHGWTSSSTHIAAHDGISFLCVNDIHTDWGRVTILTPLISSRRQYLLPASVVNSTTENIQVQTSQHFLFIDFVSDNGTAWSCNSSFFFFNFLRTLPSVLYFMHSMKWFRSPHPHISWLWYF